MRGKDNAGSGREEHKIHVYHVCTKGLESRLLFLDEEDYRCGIRVLAVSAFKNNVKIAAYCLMANHVHFMVCADNHADVTGFLVHFKKAYSRHYNSRHGVPGVMKRIGSTIKGMSDVSYVRNCVAYILRNPVEGGLVRDSGSYLWSSVSCYFSKKDYSSCKPVSSLTVREVLRVLHTHCDLSSSGLLFDGNYDIIPESFVAVAFVESLFRNSQEYFWSRVAKVDSSVMELELVFDGRVRYNDHELMRMTEAVVSDRFRKTSVSQLVMSERCKLAVYLYRRMYAGTSQIARLLGLDRKTVRDILCI